MTYALKNLAARTRVVHYRCNRQQTSTDQTMSKTPPPLNPEDLPVDLPIFPLADALLLPGGMLPLNIFEPRYLNMVHNALAGNRLIGMILPRNDDEIPTLFSVGCAGRITSFTETADGRFLILLTAVCRFEVKKELEMGNGYRRVQPNWSPFLSDLNEDSDSFDRKGLLEALKRCLKAHDVFIDWKTLTSMPDDALISTLPMVCPFETREKQALLEATDRTARIHLMITLLDMAAADPQGPDKPDH